jgi:hypothetical protein
MIRLIARYLLLAASVLCLPVSAAASTLQLSFGHPVGNGSCIALEDFSATSGPLSVERNCATPFVPGLGSIEGHVTGTADYGLLRADALVRAVSLLEDTATATAAFTGTYLFAGTGAEVTTSLNLDIDGSMLVDVARSGSAGLLLVVELGSTRRGVVLSFNNENGAQLQANDLSLSAPWLSLATPGGASFSFTTENFTVPLNVPVSLRIALTANAGLFTSGLVDSNFGSTLTFSATGNTFTVPAGTTVNGDGLVNNRWVGANPGGAAVPEPGSLFLAGTGALLLRRRLRERMR